MNATRVFPVLFFGALLSMGCRSAANLEGEGEPQSDSSEVYTKAVHVLVDGRDKGIIPMTLRIRRSFGTRKVSLWQAGEEIRIYEIEMSSTTAGDQTLQGFWSTPSMEGDTYDVRNLPTEGDDTYLIPYTPRPIKIEDHDFGITLLVED